jgi:hypothetical protein
MGSIYSVSKKAEFKSSSQHKPITIKDSRFGIRKFYQNKQDESTIFSYANPGRTNWTYR